MICGMWLRVKYFNTFIVIICIKFLGYKKKIAALAKKKDCEKVSKWSCSMVNHLYWSVTSSNGNQEEIKKSGYRYHGIFTTDIQDTGKCTKNVHTVKLDEIGLRTVSFFSLKYCINLVLLVTKVSTKITAIIEGKYLLNSI